jgi:hypothetical protein
MLAKPDIRLSLQGVGEKHACFLPISPHRPFREPQRLPDFRLGHPCEVPHLDDPDQSFTDQC